MARVLGLLIGAVFVVAALGYGFSRVDEYRETRQLSEADEQRMDAANRAIADWCLARRDPGTGQDELGAAIADVIDLAKTQPRRKSSVVDSGYVTPRQVLNNQARSMNGTCRRPVPGADRLRVAALDLARERSSAKTLNRREVARRLTRVAPAVALVPSRGPGGATIMRGNVKRSGDPALRIAVVLGPGATTKARAYPRPLVRGVSNRTAMHPVDGIDTAIVLDTSGLVGAPYTVNAGLPRSERSPAQRRGDLYNAIESALIGYVTH